ncbi:MAG: stage V sporulation protein AD [Clostridia bacterium]|nr:stage V sporulation protein AD [Clostridia bacterium]
MQTIKMKNNAYILNGFSMVGPLEGKGPLGEYFDYVVKDDTLKEKTFEKAERKLLYNIITGAIDKSGLKTTDIDFFIGGDLLNQIVSSSYTARELELPFIGLYSACATMTESLGLSAILVDNNLANNIVAGTCTHFSSAERQYRFPLELGNQRPPTSQWTITGGGACIVSNIPSKIKITAVTFGKVIDFGIADVNNMGAAMAPAACDTIKAHIKNMNTDIKDYDFIATGDLGKLGSEILIDLMEHENIILNKNYADCGCMIYDKTERVFMGGSGAGCSASVLNSYILKKLLNGEFKRVLLVSTGALMSTTTSQQGDTIPGIAHAIELEYVAPQQKKTCSIPTSVKPKSTTKKIKPKDNKATKSTSKRRKTNV